MTPITSQIKKKHINMKRQTVGNSKHLIDKTRGEKYLPKFLQTSGSRFRLFHLLIHTD